MVVRAEHSTPVDADDGDQVGAVVIELGLWSVEVSSFSMLLEQGGLLWRPGKG